MQDAVSAVEAFYQGIRKYVVHAASLGWLFTDSYDRHFIEDTSFSRIAKKETYSSQNDAILFQSQPTLLPLDSTQVLQKIINENSIVEKYNYLRKLISTSDANLVNDSFRGDSCDDLGHAVEEVFKSGDLNIVVVGAGVCGLFLANSLKHCFGDQANILVLDNRSTFPNTRERFQRNWLTHIPTDLFKSHQPSSVKYLTECFGSNGAIGIPINILEAILQLSSKDQGVKFYFSKELDYSSLKNNVIDLIFDATGSRLIEAVYSPSPSIPKEINVDIAKASMDFKAAGINQLYNIPGEGAEHLKVVLKSRGDLHSPYIGGTRICTHMIKLTGIPIKLIGTILESIKEINSLNLFYVWKGLLKDEINEGLIIVNLLRSEYEFLTSRIDAPIKLKYFLTAESNIANHLNKNIISIFEKLALLDVDAQVTIEAPFNYSPYINLNADSGSLYEKRVFPVGDSLFCGNPKMGNGLGNHLRFINALIEKMVEI